MSSFLFFITITLILGSSNSCLFTRKLNECGCYDYKTLTLAKIKSLDSDLAKDLTGTFSLPVYEYDNCTYIYVRCDVNRTGVTKTLIRTNWPNGDMVYSLKLASRVPRTSTLYFNVKCDPKSHEWKYTDVDDERPIVNEQLICHSI